VMCLWCTCDVFGGCYEKNGVFWVFFVVGCGKLLTK
jgi:hypothetical protein